MPEEKLIAFELVPIPPPEEVPKVPKEELIAFELVPIAPPEEVPEVPAAPPTFEVRQLTREEVPEGVTVTPFVGAPSETLEFALEPIAPPVEIPPEVPYIPPVPYYKPPTLPPPAPPAVPTLPPPVEIPLYVGVPVDLFAWKHVGVVWAVTKDEAKKAAVRDFGEPVGAYIVDEYKDSPTAWFVYLAPSLLFPEEEEGGSAAPPLSSISPTAVPPGPAIIPSTKSVQCPSCFAEIEVSAALNRVRCPICGTMISL